MELGKFPGSLGNKDFDGQKITDFFKFYSTSYRNTQSVIYVTFISLFSQSKSCHVRVSDCVSVCLSAPSDAVYLEASYWP